MKNFKKNKNRGFTLIELLVVIAIIGMLAATVLTSLGTARAKGRDAKRIADLQNIQLAMTLYSDSNRNRVPLALDDDFFKEYIPTKPQDPQGTDYGYIAYKADGSLACSSGSPTGDCVKYKLGALLEGVSPTLDSDCDFTGTASPFDDTITWTSGTCANAGNNGATHCLGLTNNPAFCKY